MTRNLDARPPLDRDLLAESVTVVAQAPSTNSLVTEQARAGAPAGTTIVAEWQTAGRGRLDRAWAVPDRAALTFSVLLRPEVPAERWPWLPLLAGLVVHEALSELIDGVGLKWPNDVLVGEQQRKICGILVERVETPQGPAAVLGIGINVHQSADELPVATATSIHLEGVEADRTRLLNRLLSLVDEHLPLLADGEALWAAYTERCVTLGREVRVELPADKQLLGLATGVDEHGRLEVTADGVRHVVGAGDVIHVRATNL
ncbi:biotin--[acetyl-CoA-carboxylase] ligase [Nocardioides sp. Bht2]|uniref:biotin--[acetyl-CoA-carboxylase] ligase n=1 Tax=Nocardioides sp. Bht2 TaxID=3392297 RepID=UPI0039B6290F